MSSFADPRGPVRDIVGPEDGEKITAIWSLNSEGELRTAWREIGLPNMWYMMGNLAWCRFFSKHLALRTSFFFVIMVDERSYEDACAEIKAKQEGILPGRYSAPAEY